MDMYKYQINMYEYLEDKYSGKILDDEEWEEIQEVGEIRTENLGGSGQHAGKNWIEVKEFNLNTEEFTGKSFYCYI